MTRATSVVQLPRLPAEASVSDAVAALEHAGALVWERLAPKTSLDVVEREVRPWFDDALVGEGDFLGRDTKRFSALVEKAPASAAWAAHEAVLAVIERVLGLGARCDAIQLNLTQGIGICAGEQAQAPHRDDAMFPFAHDFELMINAMWTLDGFTEANGATRIFAGSHRWERTAAPTSPPSAATAPPGSVILWLGSTLHGGGANKTSRMRRGLTFSYSLGWLAQAEKLALSIPRETVLKLPLRVQRLLGYQIHHPNLGWVEERDPLEWLRGEVGALAPAQDHLTPDQAARISAYLQSARHV